MFDLLLPLGAYALGFIGVGALLSVPVFLRAGPVPGLRAAVEVAALYRLRWQVELAFKRWKSPLGLDNPRAEDPALAKTCIYGKLIAAVCADAITRQWRALSPGGAPLGDQRVAGLA